ncbi:NUDIX hydrolase [Methylopila sp. M107]|uniref:NUDIX domain-containing protein n=1 Tax=Methylopila sp. M107 TaxID=1101190 RepID=UPI000364B6DB|nr:NUDIX hydrolase [Methylopila sp. M107]
MTERDERLAAAVADVQLEGPETLLDGYRTVEGWTVRLDAGSKGEFVQHREVMRAGRCVAVIPVDLARGEIVLIRQFRLAAHLATGEGDLVEIVAGRVEPGEDVREAARRELQEETGLDCAGLVALLDFLPTPGIVDEHATLFLASVDASMLQDEAGAADEHEHTRPFAISIDQAVAALGDPAARNAYLLIALQWLALNRRRLGELLTRGAP